MESKTIEPFEVAIEQNKAKIFRICQVYAVAPLEPQDLLQEVIFEAWKSYGFFKEESGFGTWLYRIAINVCLRSKLKWEKKNGKKIQLDSVQFHLATEEPDEVEQQKVRFLQECIATLNETDKSIVVLYLEDLAYKEIAEITGLSENHIAVKMKRIRTRLFDCITPKLH